MTDIAIRFNGVGETYPDGTTAVEVRDAARSSSSGLAVVVDGAGRAVGIMDPGKIIEDAELGDRAPR